MSFSSPYAGITQIRFGGSVADQPPSQPGAPSSPLLEYTENKATHKNTSRSNNSVMLHTFMA